jgi:hypothetical protein
MTRITKDLAITIKDLILAKRKKEIGLLRDESKIKCYEYLKSKLPDGLFEIWRVNKSYFQPTQIGLTRFTYFEIELPSNIGRSTLKAISMSQEIVSIANKLEELECKYRDAELELVPYLTKLRTLDNVNKIFPELNLVDQPKILLPTIITPDLLDWLRR